MSAPTHVAARNLRSNDLEPMTLQRLNNRYLKNGALCEDVCLVIDEISRVNTFLWHAICPLARFGMQFIIMGNPEDQPLSVQDSWIDQPLSKDVSNSTSLKSV